jgi:hypothetical protein
MTSRGSAIVGLPNLISGKLDPLSTGPGDFFQEKAVGFFQRPGHLGPGIQATAGIGAVRSRRIWPGLWFLGIRAIAVNTELSAKEIDESPDRPGRGVANRGPAQGADRGVRRRACGGAVVDNHQQLLVRLDSRKAREWSVDEVEWRKLRTRVHGPAALGRLKVNRPERGSRRRISPGSATRIVPSQLICHQTVKSSFQPTKARSAAIRFAKEHRDASVT